MNPYHFSDPSIRAIAFDLAKALADFDTKATAALEAAQLQITASETRKGARHETQVATRNADPTFLALPLRTATPEPQIVTMRGVTDADKAVAHMLKGFERFVTMGAQDVDASRDDYAHGMSGRV